MKLVSILFGINLFAKKYIIRKYKKYPAIMKGDVQCFHFVKQTILASILENASLIFSEGRACLREMLQCNLKYLFLKQI
jgi:hypothetical protein